MKNWKKPIAAVLAGICCVVGMPQVQLVLPALQAGCGRDCGHRNSRDVDLYFRI